MTGNIRYRLVRRPLRPAILATNTDSSASVRSDAPESHFPLFHSHPNHVDTFHSFDFFNLDTFDFCRLLLKIRKSGNIGEGAKVSWLWKDRAISPSAVESKRQPRHSAEIIVGLFPTHPSRAN